MLEYRDLALGDMISIEGRVGLFKIIGIVYGGVYAKRHKGGFSDEDFSVEVLLHEILSVNRLIYER